MVPAMCGTFVRTRRCSSASLDSGTARKRDSVACSAVASRKPKMVGVEAADAEAFPTGDVDEPENKTATERSAVEKSFMSSVVKVSKVTQARRLARHGRQAIIFALCTNFTNFTIWCREAIYSLYEASHDDTSG